MEAPPTKLKGSAGIPAGALVAGMPAPAVGNVPYRLAATLGVATARLAVRLSREEARGSISAEREVAG